MNWKGKWDSLRWVHIISIVLIVASIALYLYLLFTGAAQQIVERIRYMGIAGSIIGILVQAFANAVPVPGEFISIILMEIYGPVWGGVCSWIGGIIGAVIAMYVVKCISGLFASFESSRLLVSVKGRLENSGALGWLAIRFVPFVPYHVINYAAGYFQVRLWPFLWTTALGILPYSIAMSGLYAGVRHGSLLWGVAGAVLIVALFFFGRKKIRRA